MKILTGGKILEVGDHPGELETFVELNAGECLG